MREPDGVAVVVREFRVSESVCAGKATEELDAEEVKVVERKEESLAFLCPSSASPRRGGCGWLVPLRPKDGILDPVDGLEDWLLCLAVVRLGSKSASDGRSVCCPLRGVHEVLRDEDEECWWL